MRRRQAAQFSGARAAACSSKRRCSVPNLKPVDTTVVCGLPCKSDTDLSGRPTLSILQEEHKLRMNSGQSCSGNLRAVSFYGATTAGIPGGSSPNFSPSNGRLAGFPGSSGSSLRLYCAGLPNSSSMSGGLSSLASNVASGSKCTPPQSQPGKPGAQTQTHLSSLRGSVLVAGAVVNVGAGDIAVNGVGADANGKVRSSLRP